jgi:NADH:ubiquinone oxidoreductase subunit 6 (subunit J)
MAMLLVVMCCEENENGMKQVRNYATSLPWPTFVTVTTMAMAVGMVMTTQKPFKNDIKYDPSDRNVEHDL